MLDVQKFFIPKWINEPGDFSDILQVKFNVTNNGLEHFVVYKNMFQIDVVDPREQYQEFRRINQNYVVDNYFPQYIEDFKLRFQDITLPQSLFECELLNHSIKINQTRTLSVCFDVKQKWSNQPLDLNGPRLYYVIMMDNKFTTSCTNCKFVLLNEYYKNPITKLDLAPRVQISLGVPPDEISCKDGLHLIFKKSGNPACVKPSSVEKLTQRGWTIDENKHPEFENKFDKMIGCNDVGGTWLDEYNECESGGITKAFENYCDDFDGTYYGCHSGCRHSPDWPNVVCTAQCFAVCEFD